MEANSTFKGVVDVSGASLAVLYDMYTSPDRLQARAAAFPIVLWQCRVCSCVGLPRPCHAASFCCMLPCSMAVHCLPLLALPHPAMQLHLLHAPMLHGSA